MLTLVIKAADVETARVLARNRGIELALAARHPRFREIWANTTVRDRGAIVRWMNEAESALLFFS